MYNGQRSHSPSSLIGVILVLRMSLKTLGCGTPKKTLGSKQSFRPPPPILIRHPMPTPKIATLRHCVRGSRGPCLLFHGQRATSTSFSLNGHLEGPPDLRSFPGLPRPTPTVAIPMTTSLSPLHTSPHKPMAVASFVLRPPFSVLEWAPPLPLK